MITKCLSKDPDAYPDKKGLPHVQVALKMRAQNRKVSVGEYIRYVICKVPHLSLYPKMVLLHGNSIVSWLSTGYPPGISWGGLGRRRVGRRAGVLAGPGREVGRAA